MKCKYTWSNFATGIKSSTYSTDTNRWMLHRWQSGFSYPGHYHMMYSCNCNSSVFSKEHLHQFMWHWDNPGMDDVLINSQKFNHMHLSILMPLKHVHQYFTSPIATQKLSEFMQILVQVIRGLTAFHIKQGVTVCQITVDPIDILQLHFKNLLPYFKTKLKWILTKYSSNYYYRFSQPRDHLQWRLVLGYYD